MDRSTRRLLLRPPVLMKTTCYEWFANFDADGVTELALRRLPVGSAVRSRRQALARKHRSGPDYWDPKTHSIAAQAVMKERSSSQDRRSMRLGVFRPGPVHCRSALCQ